MSSQLFAENVCLWLALCRYFVRQKSCEIADYLLYLELSS